MNFAVDLNRRQYRLAAGLAVALYLVLATISVGSMLGALSFAPAFAESIPQEEIDQYSGSAKPDVDPGASKGADESIVRIAHQR